MRDEFYVIAETFITKTFADKEILTFLIQMFKFSIAYLEIANI